MRELTQPREQRSSGGLGNLTLPRFNPGIVSADPAAWCIIVNLMMKENPLRGSELFSALNRALEGSAAHWITQVLNDEEIT